MPTDTMPELPASSEHPPKNVLIVIMEYPPNGGGAGRAVQKLNNYLPQLGNITYHLLLGTDVDRQMEPTTVNTYAIPLHRKTKHECGSLGLVEFLLKAALQLRRIIRTESIDLVHYYFSVPCGLLSFIQPSRLPYLVSLRGGDVPRYNLGELQNLHRILKPFNRMVLRRAAQVLALSNDLGLKAKRELHYHGRIKTIYNGSNFPPVEYARQEPHSPFRILSVGRLVQWKGIDLLIRALDALKDSTLTIVGDGPARNGLENLANTLNVQTRVRFVGAVPHQAVRDMMLDADAFCLPSQGDSFGQVYVEAMSQALPVVACEAAGVPEVVTAACGALVPVGSEKSVRRALLRLQRDPIYYRRASLAALERAKSQFSWEASAVKHYESYCELLYPTRNPS